jgi:hypothetical protein
VSSSANAVEGPREPRTDSPDIRVRFDEVAVRVLSRSRSVRSEMRSRLRGPFTSRHPTSLVLVEGSHEVLFGSRPRFGPPAGTARTTKDSRSPWPIAATEPAPSDT